LRRRSRLGGSAHFGRHINNKKNAPKGPGIRPSIGGMGDKGRKDLSKKKRKEVRKKAHKTRQIS